MSSVTAAATRTLCRTSAPLPIVVHAALAPSRLPVHRRAHATAHHDVGDNCSIALGSAANDLPHIAWSSAGTGQVHYTHYDGAQWATEVLDEVGTQGGRPCLALDAADDPHIACYDADTGSLKYAAWAP